MNNFNFLKTIDKNLFDIISDAEHLYKDEYFEQCIGQTRRFGEVICKNVLGNMRTEEKTFDEMLATLKDKAINNIQEKEFIDDLDFLKREGNSSVHSSKVNKNGIIALECLQRAFEIAINYAVYYKKSNSNLLKLNYDTELLITGKRSKNNLSEKYLKEKKKIKINKKNNKIVFETKKNSFFKLFIFITSVISIILILTIYLLSFLTNF